MLKTKQMMRLCVCHQRQRDTDTDTYSTRLKDPYNQWIQLWIIISSPWQQNIKDSVSLRMQCCKITMLFYHVPSIQQMLAERICNVDDDCENVIR